VSMPAWGAETSPEGEPQPKTRLDAMTDV
jgi:hypothetical protein